MTKRCFKMKISKIVSWLDATLNTSAFDDVSNNGVQISSSKEEISSVAFAVDASVKSIEKAAEKGAGMLVVHHGISWGGGIKRLEGGVYRVAKAAIVSDLAVYACHLPLDAHPVLGNNARLVKEFNLVKSVRAFRYRSSEIGFVAKATARTQNAIDRFAAAAGVESVRVPSGVLVGVCSGGAGDFAEEAKRRGCEVFITGEANWGDVIAAENCGMKMLCLGHYATEVWGVRSLSAAMKKALGVQVFDLT
jgi:dinuclear metal center YbgI/SA1388 family protein